MTRAEKVAEAQRLLRARLDVSGDRRADGRLQHVHCSRVADRPGPVESEGRKASYGSLCVDCGKPTDGSGGRAVIRTRCASCTRAHRHATRFWTPEQIIEALQVWAENLGRPPVAREATLPDRYVPLVVVQMKFGSWNAAIEAAGFTPVPVGSYRRVSDRRHARRTTGVVE